MNDQKLEELRKYFDGYGSRHDETILKLIDKFKHYRGTIESAESELNYALNSNKTDDIKKFYVTNARRILKDSLERDSDEKF